MTRAGMRRSWIFCALLAAASLCACAPDTPTTQSDPAHAPSASPAPNAATAPSPATTPGEDPHAWMRSSLWRAAMPCLAQAQMIYDQVGGRLRGRTIEQQMDDYAARDDLGPDKTAMLVKIRAQIEKLYAAPENVAVTLGAGVAAECLSASAQAGVDNARAHHCFQRYLNPVMQRAYVDTTPPADSLVREANHQFYLCLRGDAP